jgi:hypothetical protein
MIYPMIYLRSIFVGAVAVAIATILLVAGVALPVILIGGYWGWDFAPSVRGSVFALCIFAAGFYWEFRRLSKRRRSSSQ